MCGAGQLSRLRAVRAGCQDGQLSDPHSCAERAPAYREDADRCRRERQRAEQQRPDGASHVGRVRLLLHLQGAPGGRCGRRDCQRRGARPPPAVCPSVRPSVINYHVRILHHRERRHAPASRAKTASRIRLLASPCVKPSRLRHLGILHVSETASSYRMPPRLPRSNLRSRWQRPTRRGECLHI